MKILVADKLAPAVAPALKGLEMDVVTAVGLKGPDLTAKIAEVNPDVLIVRSTKVTAADIDAAPGLKLVIRAGAGVNTIDVAHATEKKVKVANTPGKNSIAVAELTLGHLLNLDRRIADNVAAIRAHQWNKKGFGTGRGLYGRTLAVLGCGNIGCEVIKRAKAFGMNIVAWSKDFAIPPETLGVKVVENLVDAVREADAISIHVALVPATKGMINKDVFDAMKPGAYLINAARAEVVDEAAMVAAIAEKGIRVGTDVFSNEPAQGQAEFNHPLADNKAIYGTHHIGASTEQAEESVGEEVVRIVGEMKAGRTIPNVVNA
jgi:D-3-phosphoglycerate dehydrogenase